MRIFEGETFIKGYLIGGDETYYNDKKAVVIKNYGIDDFRINLYNKVGDTWVNELSDRASEVGVEPEVMPKIAEIISVINEPIEKIKLLPDRYDVSNKYEVIDIAIRNLNVMSRKVKKMISNFTA